MGMRSVSDCLSYVSRFVLIEGRKKLERHLTELPHLADALVVAIDELRRRLDGEPIVVSLYHDREIRDEYILVRVSSFGDVSVEKKLYEVEDILIEMLKGKDGWIQLA
ncbi:MAG: hypothetical protein QXP01_08315 [Candidatus Hadarchaeum sp.]